MPLSIEALCAVIVGQEEAARDDENGCILGLYHSKAANWYAEALFFRRNLEYNRPLFMTGKKGSERVNNDNK